MERLTDYSDDECTYIIGVGNKTCEEFCKYVVDGCRNCYIQQAFKKLADYEDLKDQGLLVRLPCKVGDAVYDNFFGYLERYEIKAISYGYCYSYIKPNIKDEIIFYCENYNASATMAFPMSEIGKTVFLTREEAEKKLEDKKKWEEMLNNETRRSN